MDSDIKFFLTFGFTLFCGALSVAGVIIWTKNKVENLVEEHKNIWKIIDVQRNKFSEHEKDSSATRLEIEKQISATREMIIENSGELETSIATIISSLNDLKEKIVSIEHFVSKKNG